MSRAPANFRQSDLDRAIRCVKKNSGSYEVILDGARVIVRGIDPKDTDKPVAGTKEIIL
jgi:hypothetical protein